MFYKNIGNKVKSSFNFSLNSKVLEDQEISDYFISQVESFFSEIKALYLNNDNKNLAMLILENDLKLNSSDLHIFELFQKYNISTILISCLESQLGMTLNRASLILINEISLLEDQRYVNSFISNSISNYLMPLIDNNQLAPFVIFEVSIICKQYNSYEFMRQMNITFHDIFNYIVTKRIHTTIMMNAFKNFIDCFDYDQINQQNNFEQLNITIQILEEIEQMIDDVSIEYLTQCGNIFLFIIKLSAYNSFFDILKKTKLPEKLINVMYRISPYENIEFLQILLVIISSMTEYSDCPQILETFIVNTLKSDHHFTISAIFFCIIGNLCELPNLNMHDSDSFCANQNFILKREHTIEEFLKNGLMQIIKTIIYDGKNVLKNEAMCCLAKILIYSTSEQFNFILEELDIPLYELLRVIAENCMILTDSSIQSHIQAIIRMIHFAQTKFSQSELIEFVNFAEIPNIFDAIANEELSDEEKKSLTLLEMMLKEILDSPE